MLLILTKRTYEVKCELKFCIRHGLLHSFGIKLAQAGVLLFSVDLRLKYSYSSTSIKEKSIFVKSDTLLGVCNSLICSDIWQKYDE